MARRNMVLMSSGDNCSKTMTRERDISGEITSNEGFSVVAPISDIRPLSTWGKKASCWALLKRWISSTNRIVRMCRFQFCRARSITFSTSAFLADTADTSMKSALTSLAIILARVVLPVPGGPQKISETGSPFSTMGRKMTIALVWPTTSSRVFGRMRSASGCMGRLTSLFMPIL